MTPTQVMASMHVLRLAGSRAFLKDSASATSCSIVGSRVSSRPCSSLTELGPARGAIIWPNAWNAMPPGSVLLERTLRRWSVQGSR